MAGKTKNMQQIRNILQQKINGLSIRAIVLQSGVSRNTVRGYLRLVEHSAYTFQEVLNLSDEALGQLLFEVERPPTIDPRYTQLQEKLAYYATELKKRHVTRQLLCGKNIGKRLSMAMDTLNFAVISMSISGRKTLQPFSLTGRQKR